MVDLIFYIVNDEIIILSALEQFNAAGKISWH